MGPLFSLLTVVRSHLLEPHGREESSLVWPCVFFGLILALTFHSPSHLWVSSKAPTSSDSPRRVAPAPNPSPSPRSPAYLPGRGHTLRREYLPLGGPWGLSQLYSPRPPLVSHPSSQTRDTEREDWLLFAPGGLLGSRKDLDLMKQEASPETGFSEVRERRVVVLHELRENAQCFCGRTCACVYMYLAVSTGHLCIPVCVCVYAHLFVNVHNLCVSVYINVCCLSMCVCYTSPGIYG